MTSGHLLEEEERLFGYKLNKQLPYLMENGETYVAGHHFGRAYCFGKFVGIWVMNAFSWFCCGGSSYWATIGFGVFCLWMSMTMPYMKLNC
ncbi:hypothetical protein LINPERPRIM_LOCUS1360 [Linum perenne]